MTTSLILLLVAVTLWILLELGLEAFFRSPIGANKQDGWHSKIFNQIARESPPFRAGRDSAAAQRRCFTTVKR
ncbi:hypothetical protein [Acidithiobacillus ferrooxidans]|uniref:hypothetical protein n=1 Tax=Acidithiobacillus ferrooxidans TaxID=920 RepID=UPI000AD02045|nr:hypothetical protein [Acidithiobacillus ferrooxidans]